jgi:hypothetical protein
MLLLYELHALCSLSCCDVEYNVIITFLHTQKKKLRVLLPVVHRRSRTGWRFHTSEAPKEFETLYWTKLLLYKPFRNIPIDIDLSSKTMIEN